MPKNDVKIMKNIEELGVVTTTPRNIEMKKKKKRTSFSIFKAVLFIIRGRPGEKEAKKTVLKKDSKWKNIVGSIRPLHLNELPQSPQLILDENSHPDKEELPPVPFEKVDEIVPAQTGLITRVSSSATMSQYASASSLRDLVDDDTDDDYEEEDPDEVFDALCGDEMIDAKAEEFIAQFYKQIQIQNSATSHRYQHQRGINH